jgi:hypothetical protein
MHHTHSGCGDLHDFLSLLTLLCVAPLLDVLGELGALGVDAAFCFLFGKIRFGELGAGCFPTS